MWSFIALRRENLYSAEDKKDANVELKLSLATQQGRGFLWGAGHDNGNAAEQFTIEKIQFLCRHSFLSPPFFNVPERKIQRRVQEDTKKD